MHRSILFLASLAAASAFAPALPSYSRGVVQRTGPLCAAAGSPAILQPFEDRRALKVCLCWSSVVSSRGKARENATLREDLFELPSLSLSPCAPIRPGRPVQADCIDSGECVRGIHDRRCSSGREQMRASIPCCFRVLKIQHAHFVVTGYLGSEELQRQVC